MRELRAALKDLKRRVESQGGRPTFCHVHPSHSLALAGVKTILRMKVVVSGDCPMDQIHLMGHR